MANNVKKGQPLILKESQQSVKRKVLEVKKNHRHNLDATAYEFFDGVVVRRRGAAVATSSASDDPQQLPKQDKELSLTLEEPSNTDQIDYHQIEGLDTRECSSEDIYKPDLSVWGEMTDQEFEDLGVCSFNFEEGSNESFFNDTQPSPEDLDLLYPLPLFDSILEGQDFEDTIQLVFSDFPEIPETFEDSFNFGCSP